MSESNEHDELELEESEPAEQLAGYDEPSDAQLSPEARAHLEADDGEP